MATPELLAVARGDKPAELLLKNAGVVNVFTGEILPGSVAIYEGRVAGVGDYSEAVEVIDLTDAYLAPGLLNGHTHIESSMLDIGQYARAVVARGTTGVITDLHELANVCGLEGLRYIADSAKDLPLDVFLMAPSCVPATHLETSGAEISAADVKEILSWPGTIGLGEVMNFPGVINADSDMLSKIAAARGKAVDGHAPGVSRHWLNAYVAAGVGSDHETISLKEGGEKLRLGMYLMIREGSSEKNLEELLPLVTDETYKRCLFVVDDRSCADLKRDGDMDAVVRKAIRLGFPPVRAVQLATINTAEYFKLEGVGAIAPGYYANLLVIDDIDKFNINKVFYRGKSVAEGGKSLFRVRQAASPPDSTVNIKPFTIDDLKIKATAGTMPVIEVVPGQIVTRRSDEKLKTGDGFLVPDVSRDILKLVVVERHKANGNIGRGFIKGFGLKEGALASSVAHDSHNIIAVGCTDEDIKAAVEEVARLKGGLAVVLGGKVLGSLALPIGGLMSPQPLDSVVARFETLVADAHKLGTPLPTPFATLSFIALPVIPELRLTDLGLVDVNAFKLIS